MRTQTVLCVLLNLAVGPAGAEPPVAAAATHVDPGVQRERDSNRRTILEDELASEAKQLSNAQSELRDANLLGVSPGKVDEIAERVVRHRQNISDLGREIALGDRQQAATRNTDFAKRGTMDTWLIRGRPPLTTPRDTDSIAPSRRPLQSPDVDERRRPGWIIPANQARTTP